MGYLFSGTDGVCFEEFLAEFESVATANEWRKSDYALILGAFLQGACYHFYRYTYKDGMEFATLCDKIRSEFRVFHRGCYACKQRSVEKSYRVEEKTSEMSEESNMTNISNEDVDTLVCSSMMMDVPQAQDNKECTDEHDDQSGGESCLVDDDDQSGGESCLVEDVDDHSCTDSSQIDDGVEPENVFEGEHAYEDTEVGQSSPFIMSNSNFIPESQDEVPSEQQNVLPTEEQKDLDAEIHKKSVGFEHNYLQNKTEIKKLNFSQSLTNVNLKGKIMTNKTLTKKNSFSKYKSKEIRKKFKKFSRKFPSCTKFILKKASINKAAIRIRSKRVCIKTTHHARSNKKKTMIMFARKKYHYNCFKNFTVIKPNFRLFRFNFIKQYRILKCKYWKFYKKKFKNIYWNANMRKINTLSIL